MKSLTRFVAGIFGVYGCYLLVSAYQTINGYAIAYAILHLVACVSLWYQKTWSQYLVYVLSTLFIITWFWLGWNAWGQGWPYKGIMSNIISLVPGLSMIGIATGSMAVVYGAFRPNRNKV